MTQLQRLHHRLHLPRRCRRAKTPAQIDDSDDALVGPSHPTVKSYRQPRSVELWRLLNKGGTSVLSVDGKELAKKTIKQTIPILMSIDETFDVGLDTRTGVDHSYELPFKFTGTIDKLTFKLGASQMSEVEQKTAAKAVAAAHD